MIPISQNLPILIIGAILGLMDGGLNPCALSVLFFLIAYLLSLGSRKKCVLIGLTYSSVIFFVYFSFMYGILNVIYIIGYIELIKLIVAFVLVFIGFLEIKDFFFYGKWLSARIPKFAMPTIEKLVKAATLPSAIILGFFVSLVEIPCAGAFPFYFITLLADRGITGLLNIFYIAWYNIFFILPLIIITLAFYFGFSKVESAERKRVKYRKYMRLISGIVMIMLGIAMYMRWL